MPYTYDHIVCIESVLFVSGFDHNIYILFSLHTISLAQLGPGMSFVIKTCFTTDWSMWGPPRQATHLHEQEQDDAIENIFVRYQHLGGKQRHLQHRFLYPNIPCLITTNVIKERFPGQVEAKAYPADRTEKKSKAAYSIRRRLFSQNLYAQALANHMLYLRGSPNRKTQHATDAQQLLDHLFLIPSHPWHVVLLLIQFHIHHLCYVTIRS